MKSFDQIIRQYCNAQFVFNSRIHEIERYFNHRDIFMKRDDELGYGIGGSKVRKFASLLKAIEDQKPEHIILEGSLNSNNVLGLLAYLNSLKYDTILALPKSHSPNKGNALWTNEINQQALMKIDSTTGQHIDFYRDKLNTKNIYLIKEGACQIDSIAGLLTLSKEIIDYEKMAKTPFDSIYIDAGTGITAISLFMGLFLNNRFPKIFVTLIAGNESSFMETAKAIIAEFNQSFGQNVVYDSNNFKFLYAPTAKSFGSVNASIKSEWQQQMELVGFPIDLTYTAKHFLTIKNHLDLSNSTGQKLIINCGSWFASRNHENILSKKHQQKCLTTTY